jgi:hypothetical protein
MVVIRKEKGQALCLLQDFQCQRQSKYFHSLSWSGLDRGCKSQLELTSSPSHSCAGRAVSTLEGHLSQTHAKAMAGLEDGPGGKAIGSDRV